VLNRVGNGAAVAALPLAAAIAAYAKGCMIFTAIFGALSVLVMLVACAPWIPVVRGLLPGRRRAAAIEDLLFHGSKLVDQSVTSEAEYREWEAAWQEWQSAITTRLSKWDAQRVIHPQIIDYAIPGSFNDVHDRSRNALSHQVRALETVLDREPAWARGR